MKKKHDYSSYDSQTNRHEIQRTTYSNQDVVKLMPCSQEQKIEWCKRVFSQLKFELNMPWGAIRSMTGRTRQSWNNVMDGKIKVTPAFIAKVSSGLSHHNFAIDTDKFLRGDEGCIVICPNASPPKEEDVKGPSKVNTADVIVRCARLVREEKMTNKQLLQLIDNL